MAHQKRQKIALAVLTGIFFVGTLLPVYGSQINDLKSKKSELSRGINAYKNQINEVKEEINTVSAQMDALEEDIQAYETELKEYSEQLQAVQEKVLATNEKLYQTERQLEKRMEIFGDRLVDIYQSGEVNYMEVLLDSTSITDFLVRFELLSKLADQDMQLLDEIDAQKQDIEKYKAELIADKNEIATLKAKTTEKQNVVQEKKREKAVLQLQLKEEKARIEKELAEKEKLSKEIESKIRAIQAQMNKGNNKVVYKGGVFAWPVPSSSRITSSYGNRFHPILKRNKLHTGMDIGASSGSSIVAANDGVVVFAGWMGAYGNTVMIEHGNNITTLYAHMSKLGTKEGTKVSKGDHIGAVGSTGNSTGPHLHFEVRIKGTPTNPSPYLK